MNTTAPAYITPDMTADQRIAARRAHINADHDAQVAIGRDRRSAELAERRARVARANAALTLPTHVVVPEGSTVRIYESNAANDHTAILTPGTYALQQTTNPEGHITAVHAVIPATAPEWSAVTVSFGGVALASEKRGGADQYGFRLDAYNFRGAPAEAFGYGFIY